LGNAGDAAGVTEGVDGAEIGKSRSGAAAPPAGNNGKFE